MGLYCASQALGPIVICLGVHTGGSVCLGPEPPHVVAARFPFFSALGRTFRERVQRNWLLSATQRELCRLFFAHVIRSHVLRALPLTRTRSAQTGRECSWVSGRKVCFPELKGEKMWATQRKEANEAPGTG